MRIFNGNIIPTNNKDDKSSFEPFFEFATEGILVSNQVGEIVKTNPATEQMFGYDKGELIGKKVEVLIPIKHQSQHVKDRDDYNTHPRARKMGASIDLYGKRKDNTEFPVEVSLSPFKAADGQYIIAFIIDITIRKRVEEEKVKLTEELRHINIGLEKRVKERTMILEEAIVELNKTKEELKDAVKKEKELNELKSRFVSMASHEFRTPLTTILSSLSLATKYAEQNEKEKQQKHISRIKTSVTNLTDILNDVLSISKLEEGKVAIFHEKINLKDLMSEIIQEMQNVAKQKISYHHSGKDDVMIDKNIFKNILLNLISNAIKFTSDGGIIVIESNVKKTAILFSVKDNGIGISAGDQKHLFERFFRAQNAVNIQGTGLGLNIVAKYVEMLKGTINFKSELEKGTTFIIKLPNK